MVQYRDLLSDTICSPITAPGHAGVAVLRLSGEKSLSVLLQISNLEKATLESHRSYLCQIVDENRQPIDQVLVTYFEKGRSFTGDQTVEISCHGNPLIVNAIANRCLEKGCRTAERGEFSFRAYYNGQIDLVQAESIQQLVTANTQQGSQSSLKHLEGTLSSEFVRIQDHLVTAMAHLEASIDFVEQDIETIENRQVAELVEKAQKITEKLLDSYSVGKSLHDSYRVLLLGEPNTGKSSLFNALVESDRAIVTDTPGTTRDMVTEHRFLGNHSIIYSDSAGLRETADQIEQIGIKRGLESAKSSQIILFVVDCSDPQGTRFLTDCPTDKTILVLNKVDLRKGERLNDEELECLLPKDFPQESILYTSSLTNFGVNKLKEQIQSKIESFLKIEGTVLVTQARHFNHLQKLKERLYVTERLLSEGESPDITSQELLLGLSEVHQLLGKEYDDEVLDKIFSQFCIGK